MLRRPAATRDPAAWALQVRALARWPASWAPGSLSAELSPLVLPTARARQHDADVEPEATATLALFAGIVLLGTRVVAPAPDVTMLEAARTSIERSRYPSSRRWPRARAQEYVMSE